MKKKIVFVSLMLFFLTALSSRPQFFLSLGAEWGRIMPTAEMNGIVSRNTRYSCNEVPVTTISVLIPEAELTFIPFASFPLGVSACAGWGYVTRRSSNRESSYAYYAGTTSDNGNDVFFYGKDDVFKASGALRYIHLADSSKYFSVTGSLGYSWTRLLLDRKTETKGYRENSDKDTADSEAVLVSLGMIGRYDGSFFRVEARLEKYFDRSDFLLSLKDDGYTMTVSFAIGSVFTILKSNQFMR